MGMPCSKLSTDKSRDDVKAIASNISQQVKQLENKVDNCRRKKSSFRDYMVRKKSVGEISGPKSTKQSPAARDFCIPTPLEQLMSKKLKKAKSGIAVS